MNTPRMVISIRSELPLSFVATMTGWLLVTLGVAIFAHDTILSMSAAGAAVATSLVFLWAVRPRRGELVRLLLDLERRTVYWAHHGRDAEEVPFSSLKAIALEPLRGHRRVKLYAVEKTGRWVSLGHGRTEELERFAKAMAEVVKVPLWYRTDGLHEMPVEQEVRAET